MEINEILSCFFGVRASPSHLFPCFQRNSLNAQALPNGTIFPKNRSLKSSHGENTKLSLMSIKKHSPV